MDLSEKLWRSAQAAPGATIGEAVWYALLAGGAWLLFYVVFRGFFYRRRLWSKPPTRAQIRRELLHSMRSLAIFGLMTSLIVFAICSAQTRMYFRVDRYGWWWFAASLPVMILMHDTYFYWTHRLMHHRRLYRLFHHTHHLSSSPTPWAAYAFSPLEAFVQASIAPVIIFTVPVHPTAFSIFMIWQIAFNVMGHCGHEIWPSWFLRSPLGWLLNTPTHHALHHERAGANFGLYFNLWDRLLGTNHAIYAERFARATEGASESALH
jgi:sterol desaturase/sphingolipid hydroxylase (fatty acid hydroxylase superfamily)